MDRLDFEALESLSGGMRSPSWSLLKHALREGERCRNGTVDRTQLTRREAATRPETLPPRNSRRLLRPSPKHRLPLGNRRRKARARASRARLDRRCRPGSRTVVVQSFTGWGARGVLSKGQGGAVRGTEASLVATCDLPS